MQALTWIKQRERRLHRRDGSGVRYINSRDCKTMSKTRKVPIITDVARHANVSTATVTRCLNTPDRVTPETRQAVMEAVRALGYTPNFGARALVAKRTNTIGAIIPTMENAIFARGLQAFQETLHDRGVTLLVASSQYNPDIEEDQIRTLLARGADALLLIGYERDSALHADLAARGVPALVAWAFDAARDPAAVGFDNRSAMASLTTEVLGQGHRRLGVISADTNRNDRARERVAGIRLAMAEGGLAPGALDLIETDYAIDAGGAAAATLLAKRPRPTAILCGNDVLAIGALHEAKRQGLEVPRDLSITGFDDIELARLADPALTTVHVPHREMGHAAALALLEAVETGQPATSLELPTELRLRASLGPAPD